MSVKDDPTFPPHDDELLGLGDLFGLSQNPSKFTLEHFRRFGPVFSAKVLNRQPCFLAGVDGMKVFYNEDDIIRLPAAAEKLLRCLWARNDDKDLGLPPLDAPKHRTRKANFIRTTSWDKVDDYVGAIGDGLRATFASWREKDCFSTARESNRDILSMFSEVFFSTPFGEGRQRDRMVDAIVENFAVFNALVTVDLPFTTYGKAKEAADDILYPFFQQVLDAHRTHPDRYDDAVSTYLASDDAKTFTDGEIATDFHQYFIGGYGVAGSIPLMVHSLCNHPEVIEKLRQEIADHRDAFDAPPTVASLRQFTYADYVVREVLRYWPMVPLVIGQAARDVPLNGYVIPKGTQVFGCLYASCHDETLYTEPERFDPDRFSAERNEGSADLEFASYQVAFGAGNNSQTHKCGGLWVAMTALKLAALHLALNWNWRLDDPDAKIDMGNLPVLIEDGLMLKSLA